jgi:hypothetical protein
MPYVSAVVALIAVISIIIVVAVVVPGWLPCHPLYTCSYLLDSAQANANFGDKMGYDAELQRLNFSSAARKRI